MKIDKKHGISCLLGASLLFGWPLLVQAEEDVLLHANGNKASVVLETEEEKDEIVSLQVSFQVETKAGDGEKNQITFEFDKNITSEVQQYRYHKDTGILNVYLAGKENLYQDGVLSLGNIVLNSNSEYGAAASVQVVDQSLVTVNKAFDKQSAAIGSGSLENHAEIQVGNGGKEPEPEKPEEDSTEPPSSGGGDDKTPPSDDGTSTPPSSEGGDDKTPPSDDGSSTPPSSGENNSGTSGGSGSHSSGSSTSSQTNSEPSSLGNFIKGILGNRPKSVESSASVASVEDTLPEETEAASKPEDLESAAEEPNLSEEKAEEEEQGFLSDQEEVVETAVNFGLIAGIAAAVVVILLMIFEYQRKQKRRKSSKKK